MPSRWLILGVLMSGIVARGQEATARAQEIIYVRAGAQGARDGTNWTDAYADLQSALEAATTGATIWVAEGTYTPDDTGLDDPRAATFKLVNGVSVYGGFFGEPGTEGDIGARNPDPFTNETRLSGDLLGNDEGGLDDPSRGDNCYHIVMAADTASATVLDGFTITGGYAHDPAGEGGGIYSKTGGLTIRNCLLLRNSAHSGGGVSSRGQANPYFENCYFVENRATSNDGGGGGGMYIWNGSLAETVLVGCEFIGNTAGAASSPTLPTGVRFARGGGLAVFWSSLKLTGCVFRGNATISPPRLDEPYTFEAQGGGIYLLCCRSTLINCRFLGNTVDCPGDGYATGGGLSSDDSQPLLVNCLFSGNRAIRRSGASCGRGDDGAMCSLGWGARPRLVHCTFSRNFATDRCGGFQDIVGKGVVTNCVLWGNSDATGSTQAAQIRGVTEVNHCCIQGLTGGLGGVGNIGEDPLFNDALGADGVAGTSDDDLSLGVGSPCVDSGMDTDVDVDTDLASFPRVSNQAPDMGAFEFQDCNDNGVPDGLEPSLDADLDGILDQCDNCPLVANSDQGDMDRDLTGDRCDDDIDGDGLGNDEEQCPEDGTKTQPGQCGCGIPDTDADGDGTAACLDVCEGNPEKTEPGVCGCWRSDRDSDQDGTPDCQDECPDDPLKIERGLCGCGEVDDTTDSDDDGVLDCNDVCPDTPPGTTVRLTTGCHNAYADFDGDGDVDQTDFGHLQVCIGRNYVSGPECIDTLMDDDDDVDAHDAGLFKDCMSGAGVPADQSCIQF